MINRIPEIDITKSIAVILMVISHFHYLKHLQNNNYKINNIFIVMSTISHTLFIILLGVNLYISFKKEKNKKKFILKQIKRSFLYLSIGLIISLISFILIPSKYIFFGIFHFMALSIICSLFLVDSKIKSILGLIIIFILQFKIKNKIYRPTFLNQIIGTNTEFNSIDHYPFLYFFQYVIVGIIIGHILYKNYKLESENKVSDYNKIIKLSELISKNSIKIYIIHFIVFIFYIYVF
tara:strand:- start:107 stop:814 length:708 start_codon:yes stop_codon:yes gene_type:complete